MAERRRFPAAAALLFYLILMVCLTGCRTAAGTDHDQIVRSAIDLAQTYMDRGQYESAISVYDKALSQVRDYRLEYNRALAYASSGNYSKAAELAGGAFESYPQIISLKKAQAIYLYAAGELEESYSACLELLEKDPYDRETRKELIEHYMAYGYPDLAYNQALIMWDQLYMDSWTAGILHSVHPEEWETVYSQLR